MNIKVLKLPLNRLITFKLGEKKGHNDRKMIQKKQKECILTSSSTNLGSAHEVQITVQWFQIGRIQIGFIFGFFALFVFLNHLS